MILVIHRAGTFIRRNYQRFNIQLISFASYLIRMRKLIICSFVLLSWNCGFAQITITPEIGLNKSIFNTTADPTQIVTSTIKGSQVGALITDTWKKWFFIQSGLSYEQKGSYQGRGYQALYGSNSNIKLNYLQVPLNAGVAFTVYKGIGLMAAGGFYAAYGIGGTDKGSLQDISGSGNFDRNVSFVNTSAVPDFNKTYIKRFDVGYNVAGGLTFKNILLKTTYSKGSGNVFAVGSTLYRNEVWNFSLGYSIKLI